MTLNDKRRRAHHKLAALPGVRPVRRPVTPGSADEFDLYYVRTGRKSAHPLVILTGGPGVASMRVYKGLRRRVAADGLDVIMIEHRGVGMSRHDDSGADLPPEALTVDQVVDDVAAVLDDAHVDSAIIYGTSYGTYIAAGVGVRHPGRVCAMILDSPLLARDDIDDVRDAIRSVLSRARSRRPQPGGQGPPARRRRSDDAGGRTGRRELYGFGGSHCWTVSSTCCSVDGSCCGAAMNRIGSSAGPKRARTAMRPIWSGGSRSVSSTTRPNPTGCRSTRPSPCVKSAGDTAFEAEPFDLVAEMPKFSWPTVVISGGRDLTRRPRSPSASPSSSRRGAGAAADQAHSVLDTKERAALRIADAVCRRSSTPCRPGSRRWTPCRLARPCG